MIFTQQQLDTPVAELEGSGLSVRAINLLEERAGVVWIRDLVGMREEDLLSIVAIGPVIIKQLRLSLGLFLTLEAAEAGGV